MLNKNIIIQSINCHIESLMNNKIDNFFRIKRLIDEIDKLESPKTPMELLNNEGGEWLGVVRSWIQCKCLNGENVDWGSFDYLKFKENITVKDMEFLAARIAAEMQ